MQKGMTCVLYLLYPFGLKIKYTVYIYEHIQKKSHNQIPGVVSAGGYAQTEVVAVTAGGDVHVQSAVYGSSAVVVAGLPLTV